MMSEDGHSSASESDIDKRAHHNFLERKRRDSIKDSFRGLKEVLPAYKAGGRPRASRAQILKQTLDYINSSKKKARVDIRQIENLRQEQRKIENDIKILKESCDTGRLEMAQPVMDAYLAEQQAKSRIKDEEDEESTESDDSNAYDDDDSDDLDSDNEGDNPIAV